MSLRAKTRGGRKGFTLIELMVSVALLGLVVSNVYMVLADGSRAYGSQTAQADTEMQIRRTLDRIALAVMGATRETMYITQEAPWSNTNINFQSSLGVRNGVPVPSEPQKIGLTQGEGQQVTWWEKQIGRAHV